MSAKASSPAAHLLRSSRLFSLPSALPPPSNGHGSIDTQKPGKARVGTTAYPVQQAIITTPSSLARGDWGLKRALPLKSTTRSSTPIFRIQAIDTVEHITDYQSASDLTLALKRIHELNLPITTPGPPTANNSSRKLRNGVFESWTDNTDRSAVKRLQQQKDDEIRSRATASGGSIDSSQEFSRWKHDGPYVAGMSEGEFEEYASTTGKRRRAAFMKFLHDKFTEDLAQEQRRLAKQEGKAEVTTEPRGEKTFTQWLKDVRQEFNISSRLAGYVEEFLDIAANRPGEDGDLLTPRPDRGASRGHPSAGLSYLRSDTHIENHPVYGPRARPAPFEGRVLAKPKASYKAGLSAGTQIGVGGVVSGVDYQTHEWLPTTLSVFNGNKSNTEKRKDRSQSTRLGVDTPGGHRGWVEPHWMGIDDEGRIKLRSSNADPMTAAVYSGEMYDSVRAESFAQRPIATPLMEIPPSALEAQQTQQAPQVHRDAKAKFDSNAAFDILNTLRAGLDREQEKTATSS